MADYYFTFGTGRTQVFRGGWVRINAATFADAIEKFKLRYGARAMVDNFVNCASMYTEEEFKRTIMHQKQDNCGAGEHEYIP